MLQFYYGEYIMKGIEDIQSFREVLKNFPTNWDGKECILELKRANYNWRQMEWWAFYFEYKFRESADRLGDKTICFPGDSYGAVSFDAKRDINWDLKAKAIKSDNHYVILNDTEAMNSAIEQHEYHGELIALCDVEYNDIDRSFQEWHSVLKEGLSSYEIKRIKRTSVSRYRKTSAILSEVVFVILEKKDLDKLSIMKQGRNSNGAPRKTKYMLNLERLGEFYYEKMDF